MNKFRVIKRKDGYLVQKYCVVYVDPDLPPRHPDVRQWGWKTMNTYYSSDTATAVCEELYEAACIKEDKVIFTIGGS